MKSFINFSIQVILRDKTIHSLCYSQTYAGWELNGCRDLHRDETSEWPNHSTDKDM